MEKDTRFICRNCQSVRHVRRIKGVEAEYFDYCTNCRAQYVICQSCSQPVYFEPFCKEKGQEYQCTKCNRIN